MSSVETGKSPNKLYMAKIWNDNFLPFSQDFEDEKITIQPNHFVVMDQEKGLQFVSKYYPITVDAAGMQKPESYKKLRLELFEKGQKEATEVNALKCNACGFYGTDKKDLDGHITEKHLYQLADSEERKKRGASV